MSATGGCWSGREFARNMDLQVGDRVEIGSPSMLEAWKESTKKEDAPVPVLPEYEVRGIFDVGYYEYNLAVVVISLRDAQDLYDLHGERARADGDAARPLPGAGGGGGAGRGAGAGIPASGRGCRRTRTC